MRDLIDQLLSTDEIKTEGLFNVSVAVCLEAFFQQEKPAFLQTEREHFVARQKLVLGIKSACLELVQTRHAGSVLDVVLSGGEKALESDHGTDRQAEIKKLFEIRDDDGNLVTG